MDDAIQKLSELQLSTSNYEGTTSTRVDVTECPKDIVDEPLTKYLLPVYKEYYKKLKPNNVADDSNAFKIPASLKDNLYHFVWGPDVFRTAHHKLRRIYDDLSKKLAVSSDQSDLEDMLQFHPTEVVSTKFIQLILAMALVEPILVNEGFAYIEDLLLDERVIVDTKAVEAYQFLLHSMKYFFMILSGSDSGSGTDARQCKYLKDYEDLSRESKGVIKGLSALYMKAVRGRQKERLQRMQSVTILVPGSVEWILYTAEALRMRRRDSKSKRPNSNELDLVELTLKMERDNPFVRWNLIECIVDAVRESNGRFHCGDLVHLHDTDQAMKFLRDECMKLCQDFPRNVSFLTAVSDYFARYVPYLYFDKELSGKLLLNAYQLNPNNPKTTHRLGIFYRMNMRNTQESLKWLEKTLELDPSHPNANMDYFKTVLGKPEIYKDIGCKMEERLKSKEAKLWRFNEMNDFQFYVGLAYFAEGKKDDTLRHWMEVMKTSELNFPLSGVDSDCSIFHWDNKFISVDKIREWILAEWELIKNSAAVDSDSEKKKSIERMFYLMLGIVVPKRADPIDGPLF